MPSSNKRWTNLLAAFVVGLGIATLGSQSVSACVDNRPGEECTKDVETGNSHSDIPDVDPAEVDKVMVPPTAQEAKDIERWIPRVCCRTNNCCRKVDPSTVAPGEPLKLGNKIVPTHRIVETGQIKTHTWWSQDGQTWRCACDYDNVKKQWIVHPNANTRCVFTVPSGT